MSARALAVLMFVVGCGSSVQPPPTPEPLATVAPSASAIPSPSAPTLPPPSVAPEAPPAPTLPAPMPPITLDHARQLAAAERWSEAAAVYDALFAATPTDARALSGRGFAYLHVIDAGALVAGRADLARARVLAAGDAHLVAQIDHNLALADRIESGAIPDHDDDCVGRVVPEDAVVVPTLVAVVGALVDASPAAHDTDVEIERPATEADARAALCDARPDVDRPGCDPSGPFVTFYDPLGTVVAHVVIPLAGAGYAVFASDDVEGTYDDRCAPDLVVTLDPATEARRLRLTSRRLTFDETEGECDGDEDCPSACDVVARADDAWIFSRDGRRSLRLDVSGPTSDDTRSAPRTLPYVEDAAGITTMPCHLPERHPL